MGYYQYNHDDSSVGYFFGMIGLIALGLLGHRAYRNSPDGKLYYTNSQAIEQKVQEEPTINRPLDTILEDTPVEKPEEPEFDYLPVEMVHTMSYRDFTERIAEGIEFAKNPRHVGGIKECFNKNNKLKVKHGAFAVTDWKPYLNPKGQECGHGTALTPRERK